MPSHIHQVSEVTSDKTKPWQGCSKTVTLEFSFLYEGGKRESYNTELQDLLECLTGPLGDERPVKVSLGKGTTPCNFGALLRY